MDGWDMGARIEEERCLIINYSIIFFVCKQGLKKLLVLQLQGHCQVLTSIMFKENVNASSIFQEEIHI